MLPALATINLGTLDFTPGDTQAPLQILAAFSGALIIAAVIAGQHFAERPDPLPRTRAWWEHRFNSLLYYLVALICPILIFCTSAGLSAAYALGRPTPITSSESWATYYGYAVVVVTGSVLVIYDEHRMAAVRARLPACQITCPECTLPCPCNRPCPCRARGRHKDGCHQPIPGADHQGPDCTQKCLCGAACPCGEPCGYCTRNTSPWRGLKQFRRNRPAPAASSRARGR